PYIAPICGLKCCCHARKGADGCVCVGRMRFMEHGGTESASTIGANGKARFDYSSGLVGRFTTWVRNSWEIREKAKCWG
ncbi:MAG: hypothetical protein ACUVX8_14265, partial [Candidatus Zipacnadales bacterium]